MTVPDSADQAPGRASVATSGPAAPAATEEGIQDIVVTAQRRSESVQRSSLAIEVLSGDAAKTVTRPMDLTAISPGIQVGSGGVNSQVYIRGVGDASGNSRAQSGVAFNVDGVYFPRGTQVTPSFYDLDRIEILKGPQGTLYGRNASGGAINIITRRPKLGEVEGFVEAEAGSFNLKEITGAVNVPFGSTIAVRASGQIIDRDGYTSDGGQDQKTQAGRIRALWKPADDFSILLNGDIVHIGGIGSGVVIKPTPNGDPWRGNAASPLPFPFLFSAATAPLTAPNDRQIDSTTKGVSAEINADLGFATLTVIPAYRHQDQTYTAYSTNFRFYEKLKDDQTSLEARLGNASAALSWVAGLYIYQDKQNDLIAPLLGAQSTTQFNTTLKSYAGFGETTLSVTHALRAIAGIRYTHEETTGTYRTGTGAPPVIPVKLTGPIVDIGKLPFEKVTYKVGAEYDLSSTSMLFATYATGYKAGGFSQTVACGADPFGGEELDALTIGSRNRFLGNRLQVNVEGFRWKYKDQQFTFTGPDQCGGTTQLTRNLGNATIQGGNLDVTFKLSPDDTLHGGVEYTHSKYDSYLLTQLGLGQFAAGSGTLCSTSATAGRPGFFNINCTGQQLPRTPEWSGTASYQHVFRLANSGNVTFNGNVSAASGRWIELSYLPNGRGAGYALLGANLSYHASNDRWSLEGYVTNITNEAVYTSGNQVGFLAPNGYRIYTANILAPRQFGARARFNF